MITDPRSSLTETKWSRKESIFSAEMPLIRLIGATNFRLSGLQRININNVEYIESSSSTCKSVQVETQHIGGTMLGQNKTEFLCRQLFIFVQLCFS